MRNNSVISRFRFSPEIFRAFRFSNSSDISVAITEIVGELHEETTDRGGSRLHGHKCTFTVTNT